MEILRSKIGLPIEEDVRQKMINEIYSLLRRIGFDLQGESLHGESLLEFAGRTVKSRYSRSLGDIIHKIYSQMELYSFDSDDIEASDPLLNSDSCDLMKDADDNDTKPPADAIGSAPGSSSSKKPTRPLETAVFSEQDVESSRETQLLKAQEQRYRAQRFLSFTSWIPDLQRVWALKLPRAERSSGESYPKKSRKRKRHITANDMVCETPMTGKRVPPIGGGDGGFESGQGLCRSISKIAWFMDVLQVNLQAKAKIYKDVALSCVFLMDNGRYIIQKVKDSELRDHGYPELRPLLCIGGVDMRF